MPQTLVPRIHRGRLLGLTALLVALPCAASQPAMESLQAAPTAVMAAISNGPAGTMSAQYSDSPAGEGIANVMDGSNATKYLTFHSAVWLRWKAASPTIVTSYALTSANDFPARDPRNFTLQGSQDGTSRTTLNTQSSQSFSARFQKKSYAFANSTAYLYYRLNITANGGDRCTQLAEWDLTTVNPTAVVTLYEHCSYGGFAVPLNVGSYTAASLASLGASNDKISSMKIASGFQATVYENDNFSGKSLLISGDDECLVNEAFNDLVSSMVVAKKAVQTVPVAPAGLAAAVVSTSQINLSWTDRSDNENVFRVELSTNGTSFSSRTTAAANATSATVSGLTAGTKYYFRVRAENAAGNSAYTAVVSATTQSSSTGDWSGFVAPAVDFTDEASGLEGSAIFRAAIPNPTQMMKEQCLAVCKELYTDNNDHRVTFSKLHLLLQNDPNGVAAKWGNATEIWIGISSQYLANFYRNNGNSYDMVQKEVRGILSHEGTHGYQWSPKNCGSYDGSSVFWGFVEGEADGVRAELTNWTPTRRPSKGGNWNSGYTTGGFFLSWCKHNKKQTFLIELNHAARDLPTFTWEAAFQQILGQSVQSVWNEYQATLP